MGTPHNQAEKGEIAKGIDLRLSFVLEFIAEKFLLN